MSVCVCVRARERESERARERRYARARAFAHTSGVRVYAVYTYIALRTRIGLEIYHHPEIANITNTQLTSLLYDTRSLRVLYRAMYVSYAPWTGKQLLISDP